MADSGALSSAGSVHSEIDRAVSNFKKDGSTRKTYKYLKEKLGITTTLESSLTRNS